MLSLATDKEYEENTKFAIVFTIYCVVVAAAIGYVVLSDII